MYCGPASADLSSILYSYINNTGLRTLQNAIKSEIPAQFLKALHTHIGVFSAQGLDGAWLASLRLPCVTYVHLLRSCNGATCSCVSSAICRHSFALTLFWQHVGVNHRNSKTCYECELGERHLKVNSEHTCMLLDWLIQVCLVIKSNIWRRQMTNKDWLIGFLSFFEFKTNSCHTLPKARNKQDINSERSHSELYPYDPKGLKEQGGRGHPRGKPHEPWINTENSSACDFKFAFLQYKMPTHIYRPLLFFTLNPPRLPHVHASMLIVNPHWNPPSHSLSRWISLFPFCSFQS